MKMGCVPCKRVTKINTNVRFYSFICALAALYCSNFLHHKQQLKWLTILNCMLSKTAPSSEFIGEVGHCVEQQCFAI